MKTLLQKAVLQLILFTGLILALESNESLAQTITTFPGSTGLNNVNLPYGAVVDASGNVYVANYNTGIVNKITPAGVFSTFATVGGAIGLAVDPTFPTSGSLYVSSYDNNAVYKVSNAGVVTPFCTTLIDGPEAIARDAAGNIYVWDYNDARIYKVNTSGTPTLFAGTGVGGNTGDNGSALSATFGGGGEGEIAVDANNNVYLADMANNRVRMIAGVTGGGKIAGNVYAFAGTGATGSTGDGAAATSALLNNPGGIRLDAAGNVYIVDRNNHKIRKVNTAGIISTFAGTGSPGSTGDGGLAGSATLSNPYGLAVDATDNLYVVDFGNNKVRKITPTPVSCFTTMSYSLASNPTISSPYICAVADYNKDGKNDLAVSNFTNGQITVFMGNGNGTFGTGTSIPLTGSGERGVVTADFNSDGNADLAVCNQGSNTVSILFGNGNGTFGTSVQYATGSNPYQLVAADLNADGKADLIVPNSAVNTVTVLLNNGSGVFTNSATPTVGTGAEGVTVADFTGDGKADLAVCNQGSNDISLVVGNGNGTFGTVTTVVTGLNQPWQIAHADFDGDGKLDLTVNNRNASTVGVYKGSGTGTFTAFPGSPIAGFNNVLGVVTGDFNTDGKADIITSNYGGASASVLLGNGAGGFTLATSPAAGSNPWSVTVADFNNDTKLDIIAMNASNTTILLNTSPIVSASANSPLCTGATLNLTGGPASMTSYAWSGPNSFTSASQSPTIPSVTLAEAGTYTLTVTTSGPCTATASVTVAISPTPTPVNLGSITACGSYTVGSIVHTTTGVYTDHITTAKGCDSAVTVNLTIKQPGTFTQTLTRCAGQSVAVGSHTYTSTGTYVDRLVGGAANGCDSIVTTNLTVYYGSGPASFAGFANTVTGTNSYGIVNADFNGDGKTDLAIASQGSGNVTVKLGDGLGGFATSATLTSSQAVALASADFNGDGKADLAVSNTNGVNTISIFLGNGSGGFGAATTVPALSTIWSVVAVDLNNDNKIDLVAGNGSGGNTVSVMLGNGNGTFQAKTDYTMGTSSYAAVVADFNSDGKLDIITPNFGASNVTTLRGNGDGTFNPTLLTTSTSANPRFLTVNDFNSDGKLDFAVVYQGFTTLGVFLGNGSGGYGAGTNYTIGSNPISVTSGDFNGDGKIDLVSGNYGDNTLSLLLGTGSGTFGTATSIPASTNPTLVIGGDYNGDGKTDLAAANYGTANSSVWLNTTALVTTATAIVSPNPVCTSGTNSTLNFTSPAGMASYTWTGPNGFTSGIQTPSLASPTAAAAGAYSITVTDSHGCTATASTVAVVVNTPKTFTQAITACGSFLVGSTTYTTSGTKVTALTSVGGCDSTVTTNLTILPVATNTQTVTICANQTVTVGIHTYTAAGTYTDRLTGVAANGCDSIVTTTVNVVFGNGGVSFSPTAGPTIASPYISTIADFNNDGKNDLIVTNNASAAVTYFRGNGDGTFVAGVSVAVTGSTAQRGIVSADFNSDGKMDFAVANQAAVNRIYVVTGNGNGTFNAAVFYGVGTGSGPYNIAKGDFNNDGKTDLAATNTGTNTLTVLLNNGSGVFATSATPTVGTAPNSITTADFNGDGNTDMASVNQTTNNISVMLGTGTGTFGATTTVAGVTLNQPWEIANADFNGDGKIDLVTNNRLGNNITILRGDGLGGFTQFAGSPMAVGSAPLHVVTTDVNNDGKMDIICGNYSGNTASILLGNGVGGFSIFSSPAVGTGPWSVKSGDLNGDGKPDLVACNASNLTVLLGTGTGAFAPVTAPVLTLASPYITTIADFNNDGKNDIISTNNASGNVSYFRGNGDGTFVTAVSVAVTGSTAQRGIVSADFNSDGKMDFAVANQAAVNRIYVVLGNGNGTFNTAVFYGVGTGTGPYNLSTGDFNGDGKVDLVAANSGTNTLTVLLNNGAGVFTTSATPTVGTMPYSITSADFNGDSKIDMACVNQTSNNVSIMLGNGNGTFAAATTVAGVTLNQPWEIANADFNKDGKIDLVTNNRLGNNITILRGDGLGGFTQFAGSPFAVGSAPLHVVTADANGDGNTDILVGNYSGNTVSVLLGNGTGGFTLFSSPAIGTNPWSVKAGDFNGDGKPDLVACNGTNLTVLLNLTPTLVNAGTAVATPNPVCANATLTLTGGPVSLSNYAWSGPNNYASSGQVATLIPTSLGGGEYSLTVTDSRGCSGMAKTANVALKSAPAISVTPQSAVCIGGTSANLTASGGTGYTWAPNTDISATTGAAVTVQISNLTFYTVTGAGANGCSGEAVVPVATVATGGTISPSYSIICSGGTKLLTVTGAAGKDYRWEISPDGVNWSTIAGATNTSYTTTAGNGTSKKYYRLIAESNACWNVSSTTSLVEVSNTPIIITATAATDNSVTLNWAPVGSGNYTINYSGPTSGSLPNVTPPKVVTGLSANGSYNFTIVQTGTGLGACPATGTLNGVKTLCTSPTGVVAIAPGSSLISVNWTGPVASYRVFYRPLFSATSYAFKDVATNSATITKYGANNISGSTTYEIYVVRLDCPTTGILGQPSSKVYVTTPPTISCAAPVIDSVKSICPVQIEVWVHGAASNQYQIYLQRLTPTVQAVNSYPITGGHFSINIGSAGQTYLIAAASRCAAAPTLSNLVIWPGNLTVKPICDGVTNLLLSNPICKGFTASWNIDQCLSNSASYYQMYIRQVGTVVWNSYPVTPPASPIGPFKKVTWLDKGRTYEVYIKAVYNCNGFVSFGQASQIQTINTLSAGCREGDDEIMTEQPTLDHVPVNADGSITLYPNPNTGQFAIEINTPGNDEEGVQVEVINLLGQTITTHLTVISNGHMDEFITLPANTAAGNYFVKVTVGENTYTTKMNISR